MNRRGFISMLAGAAGAPLVPWRGIIEPIIFLPSAGAFSIVDLLTAEYAKVLNQLGAQRLAMMAVNPPIFTEYGNETSTGGMVLRPAAINWFDLTPR